METQENGGKAFTMRHNLFGFLKAINLVIITTLMLSFTFQGSGVIGAQAKSPDFNKTRPSSSGVVQDISSGMPVQQENQSGPFHTMTK